MLSAGSFVALLTRVAESVARLVTDIMATLETQHVPDRQFSALKLTRWITLDSHRVIEKQIGYTSESATFVNKHSTHALDRQWPQCDRACVLMLSRKGVPDPRLCVLRNRFFFLILSPKPLVHLDGACFEAALK